MRSGRRKKKSSRRKRRAVERRLDVLDDVVLVADVGDNDAVLIFGKNGTGKTWISGSWPKPMLILDCGDKGVRTLRNVEGIVVKRVRDWETFEQVYWYLLKNPKEYKTVSIDTATQLQNLAVNKILVEAGKSTENAGDWGTLSQENWGEVSALLKAWITSYCDLAASEEEGGIGLDVVWLAQLRIEEVEQDDPEVEIEPDAGPAIIPSVSQHLQDQCSVIGNTFIRIKRKEIKRRGKTLIREKPQYCMRIGPNPVYRTKLRTDPETAVPEYLVDPTYEDIHALMEGE